MITSGGGTDGTAQDRSAFSPWIRPGQPDKLGQCQMDQDRSRRTGGQEVPGSNPGSPTGKSSSGGISVRALRGRTICPRVSPRDRELCRSPADHSGSVETSDRTRSIACESSRVAPAQLGPQGGRRTSTPATSGHPMARITARSSSASPCGASRVASSHPSEGNARLRCDLPKPTVRMCTSGRTPSE